mmetsp:Transcript_30293/g.33844  ORF Transcript_30293/g.33844 Transcript_30293/m.33844 type:complete len:199 (+) Transcript_30293:56-652(+)
MAKEIKRETLHSTKWVKLTQITYQDSNKVERKWDLIERATRVGDVDAVEVLAQIVEPNKPTEIILVSQYRPPLGCVCLEFPAGLVDEGESAETAALRELKEETGYIGKVKHSSILSAYEPGLTSATFKFVHVTVDKTLEENKHPVQELEDTEDIIVHVVPLAKLYPYITDLCAKNKWMMDGKLYTFAYSLQAAQEMLK